MTGKTETSRQSGGKFALNPCTICEATDGTQALWLCRDDSCQFHVQWSALGDSGREHVLARGIASP